MTTTGEARPAPAHAPRIRTRVCIDDLLGPYDAVVDPTNRWNGWLSPHFTLDTVRALATRTQVMAAQYGHDTVDTIEVIDGGTDSDGQPRAVVLHIRWQYHGEGDSAATIIQPDDEGLYGIGGFEWTWQFAMWWCACGAHAAWHTTECENCGLPRDTQAQPTA